MCTMCCVSWEICLWSTFFLLLYFSPVFGGNSKDPVEPLKTGEKSRSPESSAHQKSWNETSKLCAKFHRLNPHELWRFPLLCDKWAYDVRNPNYFILGSKRLCWVCSTLMRGRLWDFLVSPPNAVRTFLGLPRCSWCFCSSRNSVPHCGSLQVCTIEAVEKSGDSSK